MTYTSFAWIPPSLTIGLWWSGHLTILQHGDITTCRRALTRESHPSRPQSRSCEKYIASRRPPCVDSPRAIPTLRVGPLAAGSRRGLNHDRPKNVSLRVGRPASTRHARSPRYAWGPSLRAHAANAAALPGGRKPSPARVKHDGRRGATR